MKKKKIRKTYGKEPKDKKRLINSMVKIIYIISQRKTFHRQRIPEVSCKMKETVENPYK